MKALCSSEAANFIETLRQSCGGHGYMASSNFPRIYSQTTAAETYEGENTVLWLQVARYLVKTWREKSGGESVAYLTRPQELQSQPVDLSLAGLARLYKQVSAGSVQLHIFYVCINVSGHLSSNFPQFSTLGHGTIVESSLVNGKFLTTPDPVH